MKMELPKMIQLTKQQTLIPRRIWLHAANSLSLLPGNCFLPLFFSFVWRTSFVSHVVLYIFISENNKGPLEK